MLNYVALRQFFLQVLLFSNVRIPSILVFILMLILSEGQAGENCDCLKKVIIQGKGSSYSKIWLEERRFRWFWSLSVQKV